MACGSTPVKSVRKKIGDDKYCRVCGEFVAVHSGYFNIFSEKSKERRLAEVLSKVLESDISEVTGSNIICKKCFRTLERFNNMLEEVQKLRENHRTNTQRWCSENTELIRQKRCSKSPSLGMKISRVESNTLSHDSRQRRVQAKRCMVLKSPDKKALSTSIEIMPTKVEVSNTQLSYLRPVHTV